MGGTVLQVARARMGEILWREAPGGRRRRDPGARLRQRRRPRAGPRRRPAPGRRLHQEPLRGPDLHPARPGAAPPRPAAEVQPAARGGRGPAADRRRRLDRARQHDPPDRADAARRRRRRGPPADLRAADQAPLPLRDRHVHARGDDRPRAHGGRGVRRARRRLAALPVAGRASTRRSALRARPTATPASAASTRWPGTETANGKYALEPELPLVRA